MTDPQNPKPKWLEHLRTELTKLKIPGFNQQPLSQNGKVQPTARCLAKAIDMGAIFIFSLLMRYPFGVLLGFAYTLAHDGFFRGQSLGKRVFRLRTVHIDPNTGKESLCTFRESVIRNMPLGVVTFFAIIPFWGWIILILLGIPIVLLEVYLMVSSPTGSRLGDVMAETRVVEHS